MPRWPVAEQMVGEQRADLVAAQHPPAVGVRHGGGAAVGVRVVGDHQVDAASRGQRGREVHRAGLLGVGEGHRREVGVGLLLLLHDERRREARGLQHLHDRGAADAVQRRVDEPEVARTVAGQPGHGVEVAVDDVLVASVRQPPVAGHVGERPDRGDVSRDLAVGRAARSGCRRRGRPCSRCRAAGCGSPSPSRRRRSRARGSRTRAAAWAAAAAARAPAGPHRSSRRRCRGRRRRSCGARRSRSRPTRGGRRPGP